MKAIYISNNKSKSNKVWLLALIVVVAFILLCMRIMAPYAIESWINNSESTNGYSFRINDIDIKFFKAEVYLRDVELFDPMNNVDVAEASEVKIDLHLIERMKGGRFFDLTVDHLNIILTNDLIKQFKSMSNKADGDFTARIKNTVITQAYEDRTQKIFTLNNSFLQVKGSTFTFESKIAEGGIINLKGDNMKIEGRLSDISPMIVTRLSSETLPVEIKAPKLTADIFANTGESHVEGVIRPDTNNFRLTEKKETTLRRRPARNLKELDPLVIEIPFMLKDNFSLNFEGTVEELKKRNL